MSGNRYADTGTPFTNCSSSAERSMRALADTMGMSPPQRANYWLEHLARAAHRGPRIDTWASARDRAAKKAGISPSMAARIWHRWRDMRSVDFQVGLSLMLAYERMCEAVEAKAEGYRAERQAMEGMHAANPGALSSGPTVGAAQN